MLNKWPFSSSGSTFINVPTHAFIILYVYVCSCVCVRAKLYCIPLERKKDAKVLVFDIPAIKTDMPTPKRWLANKENVFFFPFVMDYRTFRIFYQIVFSQAIRVEILNGFRKTLKRESFYNNFLIIDNFHRCFHYIYLVFVYLVLGICIFNSLKFGAYWSL